MYGENKFWKPEPKKRHSLFFQSRPGSNWMALSKITCATPADARFYFQKTILRATLGPGRVKVRPVG